MLTAPRTGCARKGWAIGRLWDWQVPPAPTPCRENTKTQDPSSDAQGIRLQFESVVCAAGRTWHSTPSVPPTRDGRRRLWPRLVGPGWTTLSPLTATCFVDTEGATDPARPRQRARLLPFVPAPSRVDPLNGGRVEPSERPTWPRLQRWQGWDLSPGGPAACPLPQAHRPAAWRRASGSGGARWMPGYACQGPGTSLAKQNETRARTKPAPLLV